MRPFLYKNMYFTYCIVLALYQHKYLTYCVTLPVLILCTYLKSVCRLYLLSRQVHTMWKTLSDNTSETIVQVFVTSCLDYYNSAFCRAGAMDICPLRLVLHSVDYAATNDVDSIMSTILDDLHWLPVHKG